MTPNVSDPRASPALEIAFSWKVAGADPFGPLSYWASLLDAVWRYPLLHKPVWRATLLFAMAAVCGLRAWIGLAGMQVYSHDAFMPIDGAWRLLNGQRPHIDFYSYMGVLAYAPTALGLLLANGRAEGFAYGQAVAGFGLGAWAFLLVRKRLPDVPAALFCLGVVLLATAPFALGYSPLSISPATTYNRYGYAALALILLEAATERRGANGWTHFLGGFSTGSLIALLFFQKITFFIAALFLVGALVACRTQRARRWAGIAAGLVSLSLAFAVYFEFRIVPMLQDLIMVAGAKRIHAREYLVDAIFFNAITLACFVVMASLILAIHKQGRSATALALAGAVVFLSSVLLVFGNAEPYGTPLASFLVLIACGQLNFRATGSGHLMRGAVLLWGSLFVAASLAPSAAAFGRAAFLKIASSREAPMASYSLAGFVPASDDSEYRAFVNEGLALLNSHRVPGDSVMSLDFTNPFSFGLHLKPARGGATALQYRTTFNDNHRPAAEWLFGSATLIMAPKIFSDVSLQESIPRLYGPYLESHFRLLAESPRWKLYRAPVQASVARRMARAISRVSSSEPSSTR